ncbi:MAG: hypothetical protein J2P48_14385 [Alphaproteobacteria bacterium]|nr:hypothetical protein [Alphaproteobacteria bacterium]
MSDLPERELHTIDSGEIAGKRLILLQGHFGLDTLILAREGAGRSLLSVAAAP